MRYLRFLKPPKLEGPHIRAVLTITTDLGESFYLDDAKIVVHVRRSGTDEDLQKESLLWKGGMRALPVEMRLNSSAPKHSSFYLVASADTGPGGEKLPESRTSDASHSNGDESRTLIPAAHMTGFPIVGVWSDVVAADPAGMTYPRRVQRRLNGSKVGGSSLRIWEDTGESIARHIWDAGLAFAYRLGDEVIRNGSKRAGLADPKNDLAQMLQLSSDQSLNVIELGCGCGISGIVLAQTLPNASVCLTDLPEAEEIARLNINQMQPAKASSAWFEALDWEEDLPLPVASQQFDVVIVTDCTYNPDSSPALTQTLQKLREKSSGLLVLVAMKIRHESEDIFWELMANAGFVMSSREEISLGVNEVGVEETVLICGFRGPML